MKTGTFEIKKRIMKKLNTANAVLRGIGYGEFSEQLAEEIYGLFENEVSMNNEWNIGNGFPLELEPMAKKLERGLGVKVMRDEAAAEVYRWLAEQEAAGRPVSKFIEWAKADEQVRYINQYRNPGLIKTHYEQAFKSAAYNPQQLEVGF